MCRHLRRHLPMGHLSMTMHSPTQAVLLNNVQANDIHVMEWPDIADYVSHWASLWCVSLSCAEHASICSSTVLKCLSTKETIFHSEEFSQNINAVKRAYRQTVVTTHTSKRVHMCNISVISEMSFHNNEISSVNTKMVTLSCIKMKFMWNVFWGK